MSLYQEYLDRDRSQRHADPSKQVLFSILADLNDRVGFSFGNIDDKTEEEILQGWLSLIHSSLSPETVKQLRSCKDLLDGVSAEEVDDPEEYLTEFAVRGEEFGQAIGVVLKSFGRK